LIEPRGLALGDVVSPTAGPPIVGGVTGGVGDICAGVTDAEGVVGVDVVEDVSAFADGSTAARGISVPGSVVSGVVESVGDVEVSPVGWAPSGSEDEKLTEPAGVTGEEIGSPLVGSFVAPSTGGMSVDDAVDWLDERSDKELSDTGG
jgi:hypothetical protein